MRRIISLAILMIVAISVSAQITINQDIHLQNKDIVGRWIETERIMEKNSSARDSLSGIFVFKEDSTYHKGAEIDNMILFGITGKYTTTNDSIHITYFDFSQRSPRPRKMWMKVLSYSSNEMTVMVRESRYNNYQAILRRQY